MTAVFITLLSLTSAWESPVRTPPLGFNTWNFVGCGVTAQILKDTAKEMSDRGLKAAGYHYVNSG